MTQLGFKLHIIVSHEAVLRAQPERPPRELERVQAALDAARVLVDQAVANPEDEAFLLSDLDTLLVEVIDEIPELQRRTTPRHGTSAIARSRPDRGRPEPGIREIDQILVTSGRVTGSGSLRSAPVAAEKPE